MRTLIDAALNRGRTTLSALLLILIAGTVAYVEIPKEADPDINIPVVYVLLSHEGISPRTPSGCCCARWSRSSAR